MNHKAASRHIHIITGPGEVLLPKYLISLLAECWRADGHRITSGPCRQLDADIGIMHIDRTHVNPEYIPENPAGIPLLNSAMTDISKRHISPNLLSPNCSYNGQVIIKTNMNFFGFPEKAASLPRWRVRSERLLGRVLPWRLTRQILNADYPVLDSLESVPAWVWQREDLVVEKFSPEFNNGEYALRVWLFFGEQEYGARIFSNSPVVKTRDMTRYDFIDTVPEDIRKVRSALQMDFGKIDYVIHKGEPILLDVNKTPTLAKTKARNPRIEQLASGLNRYLRECI